MAQETQYILSWEAPSFKHYHKNTGWHITFWAVIVLIVGFQIISGDYFGAISIAFIAGLASYLLRQKPETMKVGLSDKGIHLNELHIPYKNMQRFWVVDTDEHRTLNIETTAYLNHLLIIELEDQNPTSIRDILLPIVPEHESNEPTFIQRLTHYFKF
ncbi:MAG: hypothetical protein IT410_04680 [Candidatus Doudnabacteria bacterium]|nr:hypothetical protein [Candidatus Doudnabacteria bacterium]